MLIETSKGVWLNPEDIRRLQVDFRTVVVNADDSFKRMYYVEITLKDDKRFSSGHFESEDDALTFAKKIAERVNNCSIYQGN